MDELLKSFIFKLGQLLMRINTGIQKAHEISHKWIQSFGVAGFLEISGNNWRRKEQILPSILSRCSGRILDSKDDDAEIGFPPNVFFLCLNLRG